ncbi:MAG: response regulator [Roseiflexaceae bacterium]|nr:response regulator [Roseiflexaceae bacterium]
MSKKRVTVVNDHPDFLALLSEFLGEEGYNVITLPKHQGAFEQIKDSQPDIVICDLMFDNMPEGWALLDMLYLDPATRAIPCVLCTAATERIREIVPSLSAKGIRWIEKPFELERLLEVLATIETDPAARARNLDTTD